MKTTVWDHLLCILFGHKWQNESGQPCLVNNTETCWRCGFRWRDG